MLDIIAPGTAFFLVFYGLSFFAFGFLVGGLRREGKHPGAVGVQWAKVDDVMTFGKYKGLRVDEVPMGYFVWMSRNGLLSRAGYAHLKDAIRFNLLELLRLLDVD